MNTMHSFSKFSVALFGLAIIVTGCASSGSTAGDPAEVVGTWDYVVSDAADALNLRQGTIQITNENDRLGGIFSAPHVEPRPLQGVRFRTGELTFSIQALPGQTTGIGFSLDPAGDIMTGTGFPTSSAGTVETGSRQSGSRKSTNLRLTRVN
jgi:hypothetical protein